MSHTLEHSFSTIDGVFKGVKSSRHKNKIHACLGSAVFEGTFAALIIINAVIMVLEVQYDGINNGFDMKFPDSTKRADSMWPYAEKVFYYAGIITGALFTFELLLKLVGLHKEFFKSSWNIFDLVVVLTWWLSEFTTAELIMNPMLLRLCRLARVLRVVRLLKGVQMLDSLHVLIRSIQASMSILVWSSLLLSVLVTICGLTVFYLTVDFMKDKEIDEAKRREVYSFFGTFSRTTFTLFEATLGSFSAVMRCMMNNVGESWGIFFVVYKCVVGFAVVKVISGVFLHETFRIASTDDDLMVRKKNRDLDAHISKMRRLFQGADSQGTGALNFNDFNKLMSNHVVKTWMNAYEVNVQDVELFFHLLDDDGNGLITPEELVRGVSRLKGAARSVDLHTMLKHVLTVKALASNINDSLHTKGYTRNMSRIISDNSWKRFRLSVQGSYMAGVPHHGPDVTEDKEYVPVPVPWGGRPSTGSICDTKVGTMPSTDEANSPLPEGASPRQSLGDSRKRIQEKLAEARNRQFEAEMINL